MAYDEELANRVRTVLSRKQFTEKAMFGGLAFLINGHMSVVASRTGALMVRVPPDETDELLERPGISQVEMGRRGPMTGWLYADTAVLDDEAALKEWVRRGVDCASDLKAK